MHALREKEISWRGKSRLRRDLKPPDKANQIGWSAMDQNENLRRLLELGEND